MRGPLMEPLPKQARRALRLTHWGLWGERLWRAFWPFLTLICLGIALAFLTTPDAWPIEGVWLVVATFVAAFLWAIVYAVRHFRWPTKRDAQDRLDLHFDDQPLMALDDTLSAASNDEAAKTLWEAHQTRMRQQASKAKAATPDMRIARMDPFALRYMAMLLAMIGLIFGSLFSFREIELTASQQVATGPVWEGWVQPPRYTRKPTLYLNDLMGQTVSVPEGSEIMIRLYGEVGEFTVDETVSARIGDLPSVTEAEQRFSVVQSGRVSVNGNRGADWVIAMQPDQPPSIQLTESPADRQGAPGLYRQDFKALDDYGVISGEVEVVLNLQEVDRRHGLALAPFERAPYKSAIPLTVSGNRADFQETFSDDFSKHPWAGLPVRVVFTVNDAAGQAGSSAVEEMTLPSRAFFDPMAKALIEQRRDILWTPENSTRSSQILRALRVAPDQVFRDIEDDTTLQGIIASLEQGLPDEAKTNDVAEELWNLAIELEDGDLADAAAALERAEAKLEEAIRNGASPEDIKRLMDELRQAQRDYMQEFAERNPPEAGEQQQGQQGEEVTQDQLQEMMDRLEQLMKEGRMAEAQELLEEINRLMDNLEVQQAQNGQQGQGQQQMQDLSDTLREQQNLSDEAFRQLQEQFNPNGQQPQGQQGDGQQGQQPQGQQGQQGNGQDQAGNGQQGQQPSLADQQRALRRELQRQQRGLPGAGTEEGEEGRRRLGEAADAMDRAEQDLRDGDMAGAIENQSQAIENLREGLRNLGEALANEQQGQGQAEGQANGQQSGPRQDDVDPTGRSLGMNGNSGTQENALPEQELRRRTQELTEEIRRRSGSLERSQEERNYLKRLLEDD